MPRTLAATLSLVLLAACPGSQTGTHEPTLPTDDDATAVAKAPPAEPKLTYPEAPRSDQVDDYHGTKVADPYRPLEDSDAPAVRTWIEAENAIAHAYLGAIAQRDEIGKRMTALWNYERFGLPFTEGGRWFWSKNDGLQNQAVYYWAAKLGDEPKVLLDPNALAADGTVALSGLTVSDDGKLVAYGLQQAGSDWEEWKVRDIDSGKDLTDDLKWIKFASASWTHDGKGFYYGRYPEPKGNELTAKNDDQAIYYHQLGKPQADDELIYQNLEEPTWGYGATVTEDGRYLVVGVSKGTGPQTLLYVQDLKGTTPGKRKGKLVPIVDKFEAEYTYLGNDGPLLYVKTDLDAPNGRIIAIDLRKPAKAKWQPLVGEAKDALAAASIVGDRLFLNYLEDAKSRVEQFDLTGKSLGPIALPGIGSVGGFGGRRDQQQTFYSFTSFTVPGAVYGYQLKTSTSAVWQEPKVDFDGSAYETKQVFYKSKDGTKVPMFITAKKGLALDGERPTLLYGYGGFSISLTPFFSPVNAVWLEMGGVLAIPNLRGGAEYGEAWHLAGTKLHKQNVFDDFIAAAEWLIANKYTSSKHLGIQGRSNGGLLIGACMTQRPELFGATLPGVGVMDMLRFHKFTIGWAWVDDYGSSDDPAEFKALYAYSPLHNIKPGTSYPPTLIVTGDHDDRVVPGHSFKFGATLQAAQAGSAPILIRIETKGGHGAGKPTAMKIAEAADEWAFLRKNLW